MGVNINRLLVFMCCLGTILFSQDTDNKKKEYDVKVRLVLSIGANNQNFHGLANGGEDIQAIGFSQSLSGMIYLGELDKELKKKLLKKAPKKIRKKIKKLESISIGAGQFISIYGLIPDTFNYQTSDEFDLLFLNWSFIGLGLEPFGFDVGLSTVYYDDKDNFDKGKLQLSPSLGLLIGLSDLSFSKKFPFSFNIHYGIRYLFPSMKFYDNSKFSTITSEPSLTLNLKIPFQISVPSKKL